MAADGGTVDRPRPLRAGGGESPRQAPLGQGVRTGARKRAAAVSAGETFSGLEVGRGSVNTWECDQMGHMNVRFYVSRAMEGLTGVAAALGLAGAFRAHAQATLVVKDHHIRFLREARAGAPLIMPAGVIPMDECEVRLLQLLIHAESGELAASFQTVAAHVTAREERPFPWSRRTRELAEDLVIAVPERAA